MYNKALPPPPLHMMDPYMDEGRKCLSLYTNPQFFLDEWVAEQLKIRQAAKEERRKRREQRKNQREKDDKGQEKKTKKPTKLVKIIYDPHTGQKMTITVDADESRPQSTLKLTGSQETLQSSGPMSYSNANNPNTKVEEYSPPAPPPDTFGAVPLPPMSSDMEFAPPVPSSDFPPPAPPRFDETPIALPPQQIHQQKSAPPPPAPNFVPGPPPPSAPGAPPPPATLPPPPPEEPAAMSGLALALANKQGALKKS